MSPTAKRRARDLSIVLAAALGALGWGVRGGGAFLDARFVHTDTFRVYRASEAVRDSVRARDDSAWKALVLQKLDSNNLRLQQIICGERVFRGCR